MGVPVYIFIVPYRDRETHKNVYINHMPWILEDEKEPYEIIFSHQNDRQPFNRGAMKNLGFWYARQTYPDNYKQINFIFQDVDTLPGRKGLLNFKTTKGIVKHYYGFNFALGGIFSIKGEDFEKTNGFPNHWGWGVEDNLMNARCLNKKLIIDRDTFFNIKSKYIVQYDTGPYRMMDNAAVKKLNSTLDSNGLTQLTNVKFNTTSLVGDTITMVNFNTWTIPEKSTSVSFRAAHQKNRSTIRDPVSKHRRPNHHVSLHSLINHKGR